MTVGELVKEFRINYMRRRLKPTTIQGYMRNIDAFILPELKDVELDELSFSLVDKLVSFCREEELSNTSIVYVLATLSSILTFATKRGYAKYNLLRSYDYPKKEAVGYTTLTYEQINKLIEKSKGSDEMPAILLACHYGLRRGEACGVRNEDIRGNLLYIRRTITQLGGKLVSSTPKNDKVRVVKLLDSDVFLLKEYDEKRKKEGAGALMRSLEGVAVTPSMINKRLRKLLRELELPMVRFHDLRHSYATIMMQKGVNPKIVSSVLGHSSVDITLDLYSHCCTDMQDVCLQIFDPKKP